jgi:hypothetical protein
VPVDCKVALVVCDDFLGGGTNRYEYEFNFRIGPDSIRGRCGPSERPRWLKDWWLSGPLWSSEAATERAVREAILMAAHRVAYQHRHGLARNLRDMLAQEGHVMAQAGCGGPTLDADDLDYTREVLVPYLDAADMQTCIVCLFGDEAARSLGFTPRGLSPSAGLALALHDAQHDPAYRPT